MIAESIIIAVSAIICTTMIVFVQIFNIKNKNNTNPVFPFGHGKQHSNAITAADAYKQSINPQMQNILREIQESKNNGFSECRLSRYHNIAEQNISCLLGLGYDVHYEYWNGIKEMNITIIFDQWADGNLTFESALAKEKAKISFADKTNNDIIPKGDSDI